MSREPRFGEPARSSHWYLWSYLRGVGALAVVLVLTFAWLRGRMHGKLYEGLRTCDHRMTVPGCKQRVINRYVGGAGFELRAPLPVEFVDFLVSRLATPWIGGYLLVGALLTLALWYRDRAATPAY